MTTTEFGQAIASMPQIVRLFKAFWTTLQERREKEKTRAALYDLSDRELEDIGITPGEIEYAASNLTFDPRGVYGEFKASE
jgi:uncharacterized protein YjiS (DUF1127 family)